MTSREASEHAADRFNAHDLEGIAEVLADDVVFEVPGGTGGQGKTACIEFYRRWLADFPDAHVEVHDRHMLGEIAVEQGTFSGTQAAIPPVGRRVTLDYVQVLRAREGKHVSLNLTFDRLLMLEQLGLAAEPEPAQ